MAKITPFNMSRILRKLNYRTGQARRITYYRPPVYDRDNYGVEASGLAVNELVMPNTLAYVRLKIGQDFQLQKAGVNIVGSAVVYMPRLETLKNFPNYDQDNNTYFNEIEGWDKLIDVDRVVHRVATSSSTGWTGTGSVASDGETITLTASGDGKLVYGTTAQNTLEAGRISFQIMGSGSVTLESFDTFHGGTATTNQLAYNNADVVPVDNTWLTVDVPFASGGYVTSGASEDTTSIYESGVRYPVVVTSGSGFDYKADLRQFQLQFAADSGDTLKIKNIRYYKPTEWSVHRVNDYTDEYMKLSCVKTQGKSQKIRRAY